MRYWIVVVTVALCWFAALGSSAIAQTFYNPTTVQFESTDHAQATFYRVEFLLSGSTQPLASTDVTVDKVSVLSPGPPITYTIPLKDVPVFLPFGKSYVLRLYACNTACSPASNVTPQLIRYTYCQAGPTSIAPAMITQGTPPSGTASGYVGVPMTIAAPKPIHSVSVALVGSGQPAYYFTGPDLRGAQSFVVGPLPRAGRYLLNVYAADEFGCSVQQATQYLTVR